MMALPSVRLASILALAFLLPSGGRLRAQSRPSLLEQVDTYSARPALGTGVAIQNWRLPIGNLTLTLERGTCAPLVAGGKALGFHFAGKGSFTYRSQDPLERASFTSNFKHILGSPLVKATFGEDKGNLLLTESISRLTVWFAGSGPDLPQGPAENLPIQPFQEDWAFFNREGLGDRGQAFATHLSNTPAQALIQVELQGEDSPFIYTFDEGASRREYLYCVANPAPQDTAHRPRTVLLSEQPLGWNWKFPLPPPLSLIAVDIDLKAGKSEAALTVKETLVANQEGTQIVALNLYNQMDRASRSGTYQVARVLDGEGTPLPFHHRSNTILIQLPKAAPTGQPFSLTFEYGGPILVHPRGDNYWELGVEPWFPQPELNGQAYTVHALFQTHPDDIPVSGGKTIRREKTGQGNLLEVRIDHPTQFFTVMAGAYTLMEETRDGQTIRVATYADNGGRMEQRLQNIARQTISYYEQLFEKFPFEEFNVIQVNAVGFGQAPPGMLKITNEAFNAKSDILSSFFIKGINQRFAHEIAHQYWGHLVKMPSHEEQWITESFANYTSALALRSMKGQGPTAFEGLLSSWRNQASAYADAGTIPLANRLRWLDNPRGSFLARTTLLYEKGALLLAALHKDMGDNAFALFMKSVIANFRWKTATTASIEQLATMAGRKDYGPLFRDCYWGTQMPR